MLAYKQCLKTSQHNTAGKLYITNARLSTSAQDLNPKQDSIFREIEHDLTTM